MKIVRILNSYSDIDVTLIEGRSTINLYFSKPHKRWYYHVGPGNNQPLPIERVRSLFLVSQQAPVIVVVKRDADDRAAMIGFRERTKQAPRYTVQAYTHATAQSAAVTLVARTQAMACALAKELGRQPYIEKTVAGLSKGPVTQHWPRFGVTEIKPPKAKAGDN